MNSDPLHHFILRCKGAQRAAEIEDAIAKLEIYQSILTEPQLARVSAIANRSMATIKKEVN